MKQRVNIQNEPQFRWKVGSLCVDRVMEVGGDHAYSDLRDAFSKEIRLLTMSWLHYSPRLTFCSHQLPHDDEPFTLRHSLCGSLAGQRRLNLFIGWADQS